MGSRLNFDHLDTETLFQQAISIRLINDVEQATGSRRAKDLQGLCPFAQLRRPFHAEQKRRQPAQMIEVKVTYPDGIKAGPVEIVLGHAMPAIGTYIKQQRSAGSFEPVSC